MNELRRLIASGTLIPGVRLPSHRQLSRQLHVSTVTVQTAIKQLEREGFVECRSRSGSFVAQHPPHLTHYGLVFWNDPAAPTAPHEWTRYYQALTQAAVQFEAESNLRMIQFHGINSRSNGLARQRLLDSIERHAVAGLIFANTPQELAGSPIVELPGIPRVAIASKPAHPNIKAATFDHPSRIAKALDYFASVGRHRVAAIVLGDCVQPISSLVRQAAIDRGMVTHPRWIQASSLRFPEAVRHLVELLMSDRDPPNALLIGDDNLVEPALAGLAASGVRVPDDIAVVAHANWPLPPPTTLPVRLLGYDQRITLRTCVELINRCRRGENVPSMTTIPALWGEEVMGTSPLPELSRWGLEQEQKEDRILRTRIRPGERAGVLP